MFLPVAWRRYAQPCLYSQLVPVPSTAMHDRDYTYKNAMREEDGARTCGTAQWAYSSTPLGVPPANGPSNTAVMDRHEGASKGEKPVFQRGRATKIKHADARVWKYM